MAAGICLSLVATLESKCFALALLSMFLMAQQKPKFEITRSQSHRLCPPRRRESVPVAGDVGRRDHLYFIASPKPDLDTVITIQGKPHQGRNACKQGIPIDIVGLGADRRNVRSADRKSNRAATRGSGSYSSRKFTSICACTGTGLPSFLPGLNFHFSTASMAF